MGKSICEVDVAAPVVVHYQRLGYECYQEVEDDYSERVADIVLKRPLRGVDEITIIEVKPSLRLDLIAQAKAWRDDREAHYVWIATAKARPSEGRRLACELAEQLGIGVMSVNLTTGNIWQSIAPKLDPSPFHCIGRVLDPDHQTFCRAGSQSGHLTPYRKTLANLAKEVADNPGLHLKQLVKMIDHHWKSDREARNRLLNLARKDKLKGIRVDGQSGLLALYPA